MSSPEIGGRLIARNTALNVFGYGAPMLVAVVAIPVLVSALGTERFGVLTLAWMAIGYFNVFDLGLSRALTQRVAQELGTGRDDAVPSIVWTGFVLMGLMGVIGMVTLALLSNWLVGTLLAIPPALELESLRAFQILALSLPWVIATAGLRGFLEAKQRFGIINGIRLPLGVFTFVGPLLVLPFSTSLVPIVALLAAGRVVACAVHAAACIRDMPALASGFAFDTSQVGSLLRFGGWMTVSNVISPIMVYFDRFFIGAMLSMAAVAYYVTPYELVTRLWLIPAALHGVLFPAFAATSNGGERRTATLLDGGVRAAFVSLFPIILILVTFAPDALDLWLGSEFAAQSTSVLRLLAVGVFINSIGQMPFSAVQGIGRPELTGKLHLFELPLYLLALWWMIGSMGIVGAALAWLLRVGVDTSVLFVMAARLVPGARTYLWPTAVRITGAVCLLGVGTLLETPTAKLAFVGIVLIGFGLTVWHGLLESSERSRVMLYLRKGREEPVSSA